jgi:hypothetical protein
MPDQPLIDYVVRAFEKLGGRAHLKQVYKKVKQLGYKDGGGDPNKLIRKRIYEHSSDSPQFIASYPDLFTHNGEEGSGFWCLREVAAGPRKTARKPSAAPSGPRRLPDEAADRPESGGAGSDTRGRDRRTVVERQIRGRRGEQTFRDALRKRYQNRCLVTGCEVLSLLEAAQIKTAGEDDTDPANGLLLRADVHTLFDLDLLGIEPEELRVRLHPDVAKEYGHLAGVSLRCNGDNQPARGALKSRYGRFLERLRERPQGASSRVKRG